MLLEQIVGTLDAELERLSQIRDIIVKLGRTHNVVQRFQQQILSKEPVPVTESKRPEPPPSPQQRPKAEPRTYRRRAEVAIEPSAFAKANPVGPVVVSARELRENKQRKGAPTPESPRTVIAVAPPKSEAPDSLVRDLSQRWLSSR